VRDTHGGIPRVYRVVYTRLYPKVVGWCIPGYTPRVGRVVYTRLYPRVSRVVYTRVYPRVVYTRVYISYMPPYVLCWVYTSLPCLLLYTPGYTPYIPYCTVYRSSCLTWCPLPAEGALGSNLGLIRENEAHSAHFLPKV